MNPQLTTRLRHLRLSGMAEALPLRRRASEGRAARALDFLDLLVQDELTRRADRLFVRRLKQAGIPQVKELSSFDWMFNPKIPAGRLVDLATARFIRDHQGALLIGPPGVGKSHAAVAIAIGAIRAGYHAFLRSAFDLAQDFAEADADGQRRDFVQRLTHVDLLVLEDFGMKRLGPTAAEDLLEIFVRRHETASTLITTNRPTQDWGQFLGDVPATTAILDRFLAHAEIIQMQGKSYRLHQRAQQGHGDAEATKASLRGGCRRYGPCGDRRSWSRSCGRASTRRACGSRQTCGKRQERVSHKDLWTRTERAPTRSTGPFSLE